MGLFNKSEKEPPKSIYETMFKSYMKGKDGKIHIIMVNSFSKWLNQNFGCENKYTEQIDAILLGIQEDGYEIVDIKFNSLQNQGLAGQMEGFNTLIMYK